MGQTMKVDGQTDGQNADADANTQAMSNDNCTCDGNQIDVGLDGMTVDAVRSVNDDVDTEIAELNDEVETLMDAQEELASVYDLFDVDDDEPLVDMITESVEQWEAAEDELAAYHDEELTELRESIVADSAYEAEDVEDMGKETLMAIDGAIEHSEDTEDDSEEGTLSLPTNDAQNTNGGVAQFGTKNFDPREEAVN